MVGMGAMTLLNGFSLGLKMNLIQLAGFALLDGRTRVF
jgi:hypothetical protein